jgi:hypothetical protein
MKQCQRYRTGMYIPITPKMMWWPNSQCVPTPSITVPTEFKWEMPNYFGRGPMRDEWLFLLGPLIVKPTCRVLTQSVEIDPKATSAGH